MSNIKFDFSGKRVLITGGGQGIGYQITKDFLSAGAGVLVWERSLENIETLKAHKLSSGLEVRGSGCIL